MNKETTIDDWIKFVKKQVCRNCKFYNETFGVLDAKINTLTILQPQEKSQLYEIQPGNRISLIKSNMPKIELKKEISFENLGLVIFKNEYNKLSCVKGLEQVTLK